MHSCVSGMKKLSAAFAFIITILWMGSPLNAAIQTVVVMPFANLSPNPSLQWISESFPELLQERLSWPNLNILGRDERLIAFDRIGIPYSSHLSKASLIKIGQELDSSLLILGDFTFDGKRLQASLSILDLKNNQLGPSIKESGSLEELQDVAGRLAWHALKYLAPDFFLTLDAFLHQFPAIPNIALENYVRGLMETDRNLQIRFFRQADKAYPNYPDAIFQLGRSYYQLKDYATSVLWLQRLTRVNKNTSAARFLLGLDHLYLRNYDKALNELQQLSETFPLNEVLCNLGIALSFRGMTEKAEAAFQRALEGDPSDADFLFNLAYHLWRSGNFAEAVTALKTLVEQDRQDGEAYYLLFKCEQALGKTAEAKTAYTQAKELAPRVEGWETRKKMPDLFRVQSNFDETSFRQLRLEIEQLRGSKAVIESSNSSTGTVPAQALGK
jgi:tetratricopeptide (TPR) repeat protein